MPLADYTKREVADALLAQRTRTITLLEPLEDAQWETIVVPGWRVREVAAHLITGDESAFNGQMMRLGFTQRPMGDIEAWNETQVARWADRPVPSLLQALEKWGTRLSRIARTIPGVLARRPIPTPFGRVSLRWLAMLRVYDEWVHGEDVRRGLGLASDDAPERVRPVARQLLAALPQQTLPRISPSASGRVEVRFEDLDLPPVGVDLDGRRYGVAVTGAGTAIAAPAGALIMVAAGRDVWREVEGAGTLRITGDRAPAETFLDALRVV